MKLQDLWWSLSRTDWIRFKLLPLRWTMDYKASIGCWTILKRRQTVRIMKISKDSARESTTSKWTSLVTYIWKRDPISTTPMSNVNTNKVSRYATSKIWVCSKWTMKSPFLFRVCWSLTKKKYVRREFLKDQKELVDPLVMFRSTRLGYDYQGSAYYVPSNALVRYGDPQGKPWFYPIKMTAREATLFLGSANQKGSFVVFRPSNHAQVGVSYILSVCTGEGNVLHYNIVENLQGDIMIEGHDHSFMNICELVEYFQKNQSNLATRLRRPLREVNYLTATHCSYDSKYEINRQQIKLGDVEIGKGLFGDWHLAKFKEMSVCVKIMSTSVNRASNESVVGRRWRFPRGSDFLDEDQPREHHPLGGSFLRRTAILHRRRVFQGRHTQGLPA